MRLSEVLTGNMTASQAISIFSKHGVDVRGMAPKELMLARRKLIMTNHSDHGGSDEAGGEINAAYDFLSKFGTNSDNPNNYGDHTPHDRSWEEYDEPRRQRPQREKTPVWAMAGYSGGMPPNARIYRNDFTDMNFFKKTIWELSGKMERPYTLWGYDGAFFRGVITVYGSPKVFGTMADAMKQWQSNGGNPYPTRAVFVSPGKSKELYLIYADGKYYDQEPIPIEHESFNLNPGNDMKLQQNLPGWLDELKRGSVGDPGHQT